jgi:hypothetical protein
VIAAEVILRGTCVDEASEKFKTLAQRIFPPRPSRQTLFGQSWDFLASWLADSRHDSDVLDEALKRAFGSSKRLFAPTGPLPSGIRIALTASQVEDGSLCLLSNYRGVGRSGVSCSYRMLVSDNEPLLWQV